MCILLTPVLYFITTVIIEVYLQCFTESVSLRDIGKPSSRAEISSPSSLCFKAVKGTHLGSALLYINQFPVSQNLKKYTLIIDTPTHSNATNNAKFSQCVVINSTLPIFSLTMCAIICKN